MPRPSGPLPAGHPASGVRRLSPGAADPGGDVADPARRGDGGRAQRAQRGRPHLRGGPGVRGGPPDRSVALAKASQ